MEILQKNVTKANELLDEVLSIAQHALQTSFHTTLGSSPGALVFSRDMFLNFPLSSDWHAITQKREQLVNYRLRGQMLSIEDTTIQLTNRY